MSDVRVTSSFADFDQQKGLTENATNGAVLKLQAINGCPLIIWTEFELVYLPYLSLDLHQTFNTGALGH